MAAPVSKSRFRKLRSEQRIPPGFRGINVVNDGSLPILNVPEPAGLPPAEPTLEQMERVMLLHGLPLLPPLMRPPDYIETLRTVHWLTQAAALGDVGALDVLTRLKAVAARGES